MSKLTEIIDANRLKTDHYADQDFSAYGHFSVAAAMKQYAEWYAKKCLEIAAENAVTFLPVHSHLHGTKNVDKDSILNISLPNHDE